MRSVTTTGPTTTGGAAMAGRASTLRVPLHAHQRLVAQPSGGLFGLLTHQAIRRGSFDSIAHLERAISRFEEFESKTLRPSPGPERARDQTQYPKR